MSFLPNKIKVNYGESELLSISKGDITLGISDEYGLVDVYPESCYTGWYQGIQSSGNTGGIFQNSVIYSRKSPGGSLEFNKNNNEGVLINDDSDDLLIGTQQFTIDFWFKPLTNTSDYHIFGSVSSADTEGVLFFYKSTPNTMEIRLGSAGGSWNIYLITTTALTVNTWNHICLQRDINNNITHFVNGVSGNSTQSNGFISSATKKYSIGTYIGGTGYGNFRITNLRVLMGLAKYPNSGFVVPIYPISAIGKSGGTICSKLMLNVRQSTSFLKNSGYSNITFTDLLNRPTYRTDTPFLYDIPSIFVRSSELLDNRTTFVSIIKSIMRTFTGTTADEILEEYFNSDNIAIQNFDYPQIPMSGLTILLDSGHFSSWRNNIKKWYSLVNTGVSFDGILNDGITGETYNKNQFIISNTQSPAGGIIYNAPLTPSFTAIVIGNPNGTWDTGFLFGTTGSTPNGFAMYQNYDALIIPPQRFEFHLYDSSGVLQIMDSPAPNAPNISGTHMFTIGYDVNTNESIIKINNKPIQSTTSYNPDRTTGNANIIISDSNLNYDLYAVLLYNRLLVESEISDIYNVFRTRMNIAS